MMKNLIKVIITVILLANMNVLIPNNSASAASGFQGWAVYRDGAAADFDWHTALMDEPYSSNYLPVLHHPGSGNYVKWDSWSNFMHGDNFKGTYKPKKYASSSQRDLFVSMGRKLRTESIPYSKYFIVNYNLANSGSWVEASEVTGMRCDGVIEYIYEWYGFEVYGGPYWDISKVSYLNHDAHAGAQISPMRQVAYLTMVSASRP
jgi:hypothetical protein